MVTGWEGLTATPSIHGPYPGSGRMEQTGSMNTGTETLTRTREQIGVFMAEWWRGG